MSTGRKVFHCAVDETALGRSSLQYVSPIVFSVYFYHFSFIHSVHLTFFSLSSLHSALERLHALKRAGSQVAINAREAVRFLDRVTSGKDSTPADRVALQGPMEQYENWNDAEKFFLPEFEEEPEATNGTGAGETPLGKKGPKERDNKKNGAPDDLSQMLLNKLNFKKDSDAASVNSAGTHSAPASPPSSRSSRTSPECANSYVVENGNGTSNLKVKQTNGHKRSASGSTIPTVPLVLRPLLSALLWRLHSGPDASNAAKSCILITNDRSTQIWAQKFGIGVKNIHQLRTSIQYEEREYKNRCKYVEKTQTQTAEPKSLLSYDDESDEDELVFVPRGRGKGTSRGGSRGGSNRKPAASKTMAPPVESTMEIPTQPIDPNSFSRSLPTTANKQQPTIDLSTQSGAARGMAGASRNYSSGRRGAPRGPTRGNSRGRGKLWVP